MVFHEVWDESGKLNSLLRQKSMAVNQVLVLKVVYFFKFLFICTVFNIQHNCETSLFKLPPIIIELKQNIHIGPNKIIITLVLN